MHRGIGIVLVMVALLLAACGQVAQKAVEQTTGVQTSQQGDTVTIKGKDNQTTEISSQVPDELKSFPVPQGFKLDSGGSMSTGGDKVSVASWTGTGTPQMVVEFYQQTLPGQGWQEQANFTSGDGGMLTYTKGEQDGVTITTSKEDGDKVTISVMLGKTSQKPAATSAATTQPAAAESDPTPVAPETGDAANLPAELKNLPVPSGFAVVTDSMARYAEGGTFSSASATWFGKTSVKDVGQFYQKELTAKGWTEDYSAGAEDSIVANYSNEKEGMSLTLAIHKTDAGTEVMLELSKS
jgi:hypothetical protein